MKVTNKKINGFKMTCIESRNFIVGIARDIGPRVLYLAHADKPDYNVLAILPKSGSPLPDGGFWYSYGGHRLWSSPEAMPRSYSQDNTPVEIKVESKKVTIIANPEPENSVHKEILLDFSPQDHIQVTHTIKNIGRWPIQAACWALSVMRQNGFAIIPIKPCKVDESGLLPDRRISLWPYSNPGDKRVSFFKDTIIVRQNPNEPGAFKIGAMANPSWIAYWVGGVCFLKKFVPESSAPYPDFGCNVETYTNPGILEIETLGPLKTIEPSQSIQHTEQWYLQVTGNMEPEPNSIHKKLGRLIK